MRILQAQAAQNLLSPAVMQMLLTDKLSKIKVASLSADEAACFWHLFKTCFLNLVRYSAALLPSPYQHQDVCESKKVVSFGEEHLLYVIKEDLEVLTHRKALAIKCFLNHEAAH